MFLAERGGRIETSGETVGEASAVPDAQARVEDLAKRGRLLATQISVLQAELVEVAAGVAELEGSLASGTARQWLAFQWGLTPAEAGRVSRLARRLALLPQIRDEFRRGQLSEGTVDTLARVATPENEASLVETARVATAAQLQTLVRDHQRIADAGDPSAEDRSSGEGDTFRWHIDERGRYRWGGSTAPDLGASIVAAIDGARGRDLDDAGSGAEPLSNGAALARVAEQYLADTADHEGVLPERFLSIVHFREGATYLQDGGALDPSVAGQFLCDSWLTSVTTRDGQPVTATSRTRLATPTQVRALLVRDRCCQFPGCGRTRHLRAHHVQHRAHGGPTRLDNLALLCPTHHRLIHRAGWEMRRVRRRWQFVEPGGSVVTNPSRLAPGQWRPPAVDDRPTSAGERLTEFGRDVVLHQWLTPA